MHKHLILRAGDRAGSGEFGYPSLTFRSKIDSGCNNLLSMYMNLGNIHAHTGVNSGQYSCNASIMQQRLPILDVVWSAFAVSQISVLCKYTCVG